MYSSSFARTWKPILPLPTFWKPRGKAVGAWSWLLTLNQCQNEEHPLCAFVSKCLYQIYAHIYTYICARTHTHTHTHTHTYIYSVADGAESFRYTIRLTKEGCIWPLIFDVSFSVFLFNFCLHIWTCECSRAGSSKCGDIRVVTCSTYAVVLMNLLPLSSVVKFSLYASWKHMWKRS